MTAMTSSANALYLVFIWLGLLGLFREIYYITSFIKVKTIRFRNKVYRIKDQGAAKGVGSGIIALDLESLTVGTRSAVF